ncbi:uncharacterized protein DFL_003911 [Arthrobotrys flagrans]|uniref:Uncharacterized protein n=1 Tax=Arthrobotrys flagrans TaxID=97331 RepID=A0A437A364_ARTFL|nr:hypothetical protein DFL_003911 [Arthrobotrys flagrans]
MAAAAYISTGQFPMMGQPAMTYEIDSMTQQAYHAGAAGYVPTTAHPQQQIFLTSGQPVQVVTGPGGTVFPQVGYRNPNTGVYMQHPMPNIMHAQYAGDLHAPPAYSDIESSRFSNPRSRKPSFSMSFSAGQFGFPNNQMSQMGNQMGNQMDYSYVDNCMLCRANHPGPHPHGPSMNMHDMPSMSNHRQMSMDDTMSNSSKVRGSTYSYEGPACDPMDWNPSSRTRGDRRDPSWDYRSAKSDVRSRSKPRSLPGRPGRVPFNASIQVSEISDDDSEDDTVPRGGRMTNYGNPPRRSSSRGPQRPPSRGGRPMSTSGNNYL